MKFLFLFNALLFSELLLSTWAALCFRDADCRDGQLEGAVCINGYCSCPLGSAPRSTCVSNTGSSLTLPTQKKCNATEIRIMDRCLERRELGDSCYDSRQCNVAFSRCMQGMQEILLDTPNGRRGICKCLSGTFRQNDLCKADYACPTDGQPYYDSFTATVERCAPTKECLHPNAVCIEGVCCPKPNIKCPYGEAMKPQKSTDSDCSCKYGYYCQSFRIAEYFGTQCCPSACADPDTVMKDGLCTKVIGYGEECVSDTDCFQTVYSRCFLQRDGIRRCMCPNTSYISGSGLGVCLKRNAPRCSAGNIPYETSAGTYMSCDPTTLNPVFSINQISCPTGSICEPQTDFGRVGACCTQHPYG